MRTIGGWNRIDRTGMKFGKLVVKEYLGNKKWLCQCECGNTTIVDSDHLPVNSNRRFTKSCGCAIGKLSKNDNFFTDINTEEKAYILGFLCADGCITNKAGSYSWKIRLQRQDEDILIKIKQAVGTKTNLKYQHDIVKMPQGNLFQSETVSLLVCNKQNVLDLVKYGIIPNKTHNLHFDFSCMDRKLYRHFFRGLYDGDGTFGVYKSKANTGGNHYETMLTGYYDFLLEIQTIFNKIFPNICFNLYHAKGCANDIYRLSSNKKEEFFTFLQWLYDESHIYLNRKYNKYINIKEKYTEDSNDYPIGGEIPQQE